MFSVSGLYALLEYSEVVSMIVVAVLKLACDMNVNVLADRQCIIVDAFALKQIAESESTENFGGN